MKTEKVIGIKFNKEIESADDTELPILKASIENFGLGKKLDIGEFIDSQVLSLFREQCEHIKAYNLTDAIFLGDNHIYKDTLKCMANFIIANPSIRDDLEKLIKDNLQNKTVLYSNLVDSNEIICVHSDEIMFPGHIEASDSFLIKIDNPCLVKVITFANDLLEEFKDCLNNN